MSCTTDKLQSNSDSLPTTASIRTLEPTNLPSPIFTLTTTSTQTPSPTPTQIKLPLSNGTSIPDLDYEVLSPSNISGIQPIARYGFPRRISVKTDPSNQNIFITTVDGVEIYSIEKKSIISTINTRIPFGINQHIGEPESSVSSISANGQYILLFNDVHGLDLWSINGEKLWTKEMIWNNPAPGKKFSDLAASISIDASIFTYSYCDQFNVCKVVLVDTATDTIIDEFEGSHPDFTGSGKYISYINNRTMNFFDIEGQRNLKGFSVPGAFYDSNWKIENIGSTNLIAIIYWDKIVIWDIENEKKTSTLVGFEPGWDENYLPTLLTSSLRGNYFLIKTFRYPQKLVKFSIDGSLIGETDYSANTFYMIDDNQVITTAQFVEKELYPIDLYDEGRRPVQLVFSGNDVKLLGILKAYELNGTNYEIVYPEKFICLNWECHTESTRDNKSYAHYAYGDKMVEIFGKNGSDKLDLLIDGKLKFTINTSFHILRINAISNNVMLFQSVGSRGKVSTHLVDLNTGEVIRKWKNSVPGDKVGVSGNLISFKMYSDGGSSNSGHIYIFDTQSRKFIFDKSGYDADFLMPTQKKDSIILVESPWDSDPINIIKVAIKNNKIIGGSSIPSDTQDSLRSNNNQERITINKDESIIAFATIEGNILIIDTENGKALYEWPAHMYSIDALVFSGDGKLLASYSKDGYIIVWGVVKE